MRLIARFAQEQDDCFEIITVYDLRVVKERINKVTPALISIAKEYPAAVWFERKLTDDFGIEILYSNDKRPLVKHEYFPKDIYPMRKNYRAIAIDSKIKTMKSTLNHGKILGPIHPYHLDASQFQLFDKNNHILHFETIPFYKYRGIEKMLEGLTLDEAKPIVERITGSMSIAYQIVFMDIYLQATKKKLPKVIKERHQFLLELERIINHLHDLAVMLQFLDFLKVATALLKLLEKARESMKSLTNHRFGFGAIDENTTLKEIDVCYEFLFDIEKELIRFDKWLEEKPLLWERLSRIGRLNAEDAKAYGVVGPMARSVAIGLDRRTENADYKENTFFMALEDDGDTAARFKIRITEILTSIRIMRKILPSRQLPFFLGTVIDGEYYAYVESSAGEVMLYMAIKNGVINRFFLRDPTFLNAQVLSRCFKENTIDDLGVILKSIPLNFSANDL